MEAKDLLSFLKKFEAELRVYFVNRLIIHFIHMIRLKTHFQYMSSELGCNFKIMEVKNYLVEISSQKLSEDVVKRYRTPFINKVRKSGIYFKVM